MKTNPIGAIKHGWYAIEDGGNLSDRRGTRVGSARPPTAPTSYLRVIFEVLGRVNWTGKGERRAECLYLQPLRPSSSADILSQLTDRVRRALVASAPWEGALEPSIRRQDPLSLLKTLKAKEILEFLWDLEF